MRAVSRNVGEAVSGFRWTVIGFKPAILHALASCLLAIVTISAENQAVAQGRETEGQSKIEPRKKDSSEPIHTDVYGDPLPAGAIARLGTMRFRHLAGTAHFSPDGKVLTTAGSQTLRLWDFKTGKLIREIARTKDGPHARFFRSPGSRFLVSTAENSVCLLDAKTGETLRSIPTTMVPLAVSPDDTLLVTEWWEEGSGSLDLWNTETGKHLRSLKGHDAEIHLAGFSPDGKQLVTVDWDNRICRWNVATGTLRKTLDTKLPQYAGSRLSPDAQILAIVPFGQEAVCLWDTESGKERVKLQGDLARGAKGLAFAPDGKTLATGWGERFWGDGGITIWDVATGKLLRRFPAPSHVVNLFAPDGRTLLTRGPGLTVHFWDSVTGQELLVEQTHEGWIESLAFTPDGEHAVSCADMTVRLWEIPSGRHVRVVARHPKGLFCMAVTPDGRAALSGGYGPIRLSELATGKELRKFLLGEGPEKLPKSGGERPGHWTHRLGVSLDGLTAVSLTSTGGIFAGMGEGAVHAINVWDMATGKALVRRELGFGIGLTFPEFCPDARKFAAFAIPKKIEGVEEPSEARHIVFQDVLTGRELMKLPERYGLGPFSPDGKTFLATTSSTKHTDDEVQHGPDNLHLWELATGKERLVIRTSDIARRYRGTETAFGCDGRTLARSGRDGTLQIWDAVTGKELLRRMCSDSTVGALALSPDGKFLLTGHVDSTILLWDLSAAKKPEKLVSGQPSKRELEGWWSDLAGADAAKAYKAIWCLAETPTHSVPILRDRLRPAKPVSIEDVKRLIADLDNPEFQKREAASRSLGELGEQIKPLLESALKGKPSLEKHRRLERLLTTVPPIRSPDELRALRAIEVLEHIGNAEARQVLQSLARGAPNDRFTRDAQDSLDRLTWRPVN